MFDVPLLLSILIFLTTFRIASAADVSTEFEAANKLYEQGKFTEAAAAYEQAIRNDAASPALYFNLGNAFFKAGELGRAVAAYREAERLAPRDPEIRANLQFVRAQVTGPTQAPGRWDAALARLTVNEWAALASAALWLWLLLLAAIQLRPAWKPALKGWAWLAGVATLIIGVGFAAAMTNFSRPAAVVIVRDASLHNGPLDESPGSVTVHGGAELSVLDEKGGWLQVSTGGARRPGWIKREQVVTVRM